MQDMRALLCVRITNSRARRTDDGRPARQAASDDDDREVVAGLVHGLSVLQAIQKKPRLTQSELSSMTGLTRATARRSLITLTIARLCRRRGQHLQAEPKVIEFASGYFNSNDGWIAIASPYPRGAAQPCRGKRLGGGARPHRRRLCRLLRRRHGDVDQRAHRRPQAGLLHRDGPRAACRHARGLRPRHPCHEQHPAEDRAAPRSRSTA